MKVGTRVCFCWKCLWVVLPCDTEKIPQSTRIFASFPFRHGSDVLGSDIFRRREYFPGRACLSQFIAV